RDDCEVRLWDVAAAKEVASLGIAQGWTEVVAFSPDGRRLASASTGRISIWDVVSRKRLRQFGNGKGPGTPLPFTPDGSGVSDVGLWNAKPGKLMQCYSPTPGNDLGHLALSADGKVLASVARSWGLTIDLTNPWTGESLRRLMFGENGGGSLIALAPTRPLL